IFPPDRTINATLRDDGAIGGNYSPLMNNRRGAGTGCSIGGWAGTGAAHLRPVARRVWRACRPRHLDMPPVCPADTPSVSPSDMPLTPPHHGLPLALSPHPTPGNPRTAPR